MNIKKTLISVGLFAALVAVSLIAQADFVSQTAIVAGVDVLAKSSSKLPNQKLVLTENVAGAINDQFGTTEKRQIVLSLDNGAKFVSATATWKQEDNTDISIPITSVDDDGNLIIDGIQLNEATSLNDSLDGLTLGGVLTVEDIFIDTTKTEIGKEVKISLNTDLTTATGATFQPLKIANVVDYLVDYDVDIKNASGTVPKFKPDNMGYIRDIIITENVAGAIATERAPNALTMTLPSDWIFVNATNATTAPFSGHGTHTATPAQSGWYSTGNTGGIYGPNKAGIDGFFLDCKEGDTDTAKCSFTDFTNPSTESILYIDVEGDNENPGTIILGGGGQKPNQTDKNLGNMQIKVPKNASKGEYFATLTVKLVNGEVKTQKLKIAEVAPNGINATVVDFKTDKFDLEPVKDTTIPEYPKISNIRYI